MGAFKTGNVALVLGFAALGLAILPRYVIEAQDEQKTLVEHFEEATDAIVAELEGDPQPNPIKYYDLAAVVCGFLGIILGVLAWLQQSNVKISIAAIAVSAIAILWRYFISGSS
jgi:hypothetical protein